MEIHLLLDVNPAPHPAKRGTEPQFLVHICCGQTAGWIKMPLGTEVGLSQAVRWGSRFTSPKQGNRPPPQFSAHVYCGQTGGWNKMQPGTDVGLCDIVLDGDSVPQFSAYVYCGQTAGCIRIPLGTEASLGPGDIVLDGDLASPNLRGHSAPPLHFDTCLLWPNGRPAQLLVSSCTNGRPIKRTRLKAWCVSLIRTADSVLNYFTIELSVTNSIISQPKVTPKRCILTVTYQGAERIRYHR